MDAKIDSLAASLRSEIASVRTEIHGDTQIRGWGLG